MLRKRKAVTTGAAALPRIVLVDANVFFAPRMRDLFMHLHEAEVIYVHWTKAIEEEWARNVVAKQNADPAAIQACVMGMRDALAQNKAPSRRVWRGLERGCLRPE